MTNSNRRHIALISRYYPPDPGGGLALYTRQIAREFSRQGHHVSVISGTQDMNPYLEHDANVRVFRIVQHKMFQRSLTGATCLLNSYKIAKTLERIHRAAPIDIIQAPATFFESLIYSHFFKRHLNIPLVVKFHENKETYERIEGRFRFVKSSRRQWLKRFMRQVTEEADYLLGVSQNALEGTLAYLELSHLNTLKQVSSSPIDLHQLKPTLGPSGYFDRFHLTEDSDFLFYSGRLIYEKGLHLLVDAFLNHISQRFPDLRLAIAGEFDYRQADYGTKIRQSIEAHPAGERVHFLGRIPYSEMVYWYSQCKLFVGPSFCEPFGRVFIEAMACEAPVIGFNSGGPKEFIDHGVDGYLLNEQNADQLGQAINLLLDSPELLMKLKTHARRKVEQHYSQEQIASELLDIYEPLILQNQNQRLHGQAHLNLSE